MQAATRLKHLAGYRPTPLGGIRVDGFILFRLDKRLLGIERAYIKSRDSRQQTTNFNWWARGESLNNAKACTLPSVPR